MKDFPGLRPTYQKDSEEYVEFCRNCGLLLEDGVAIWRDALTAMGLSDQAITVKLSSAATLIRRMRRSD